MHNRIKGKESAVMAGAKLTISSRNYSSWSLRAWLFCQLAELDVEVESVSIDDPTKVLPVGETGEIRIRGPNVTKGYWNREAETAREAFRTMTSSQRAALLKFLQSL